VSAASDWENRYQTGDMPWEKGEPSPGLVDFLDGRRDLPRENVLVPGCGTGHDVLAWARHGFAVAGMDIAPSAVRLAQERLGRAGVRGEVRVGDFLKDTPWRGFRWLFEHTLFCAIEPAERGLYVEAASRWLEPGGSLLAVHYMLRENEPGPPHGCSQEELMERFTPAFELQQGWIPRSYPNRAGLELMLWWRRRDRGPS
jgi:SAM-dependent methyltransferase